MKSLFLTPILLVCLVAGTALAGSSTLTGKAPEPGDAFPDVTLAGTMSPPQAEYLGTGSGPLVLADVKAPYLLLELFSMYCPFCQKEAPVVNAFYERLNASPQAGRVKMLGIGLGNSRFEVDFFRDKFGVEMPLFPDENFTLLDAMGPVGTPFFVLLEKRPDGTLAIVHVNEGPFADPDAFFKTIIAKTGE